MSSSTPSRPDRPGARLAVVLAVVVALPLLGASASAAVPLTVVTVLRTADREVSLVVDVGADTKAIRPESVSVTVRGAPQPTTVTPVLSDQLAVALVVDASQAGHDMLQSWLSAGARFVLESPSTIRAAVVADTTPPQVVTPLRQDPAEVIRGLTGVQAHGGRRTSDALTLAAHQLPDATAGPGLVVLYTGAPDAGGETAAHLAARLTRAHVLLVVVSTAPGTQYWSEVTRATGGFLAPAPSPSVEPALDQVRSVLRGRYLLTIPDPGLPARVSVAVDTGQGVTLSADTDLPTPGGAGGSSDAGRGALWLVAVWGGSALGIGAVILAVMYGYGRAIRAIAARRRA